MASSSAKKNCRKFTLREIKNAIKDDKILGEGGFGKVFRGNIQQDKRKVTVAVKWLYKPPSNERGSGFDEEIAALTQIKHRNIVSLIGYCDSKGEEILVYEYIANFTLHYHLHKRPSIEKTYLKWNERLGILIGAARGLYHLHYCIPSGSFIHRDIKSSNILLDDNLVAKIGDFGMAKCVALDDHDPLDNERVGTIGYVDPYSRIITRASDTYSFGIMVFEVLSGRRVVDDIRPQEECDFATWAKRKEADKILDPVLLENFSEGRREALHICCDVARRCLHSEPEERPDMGQVLGQLELALVTSQNNSTRPQVDGLLLSPFALDNTDVVVGSTGSVVYTAVIRTSGMRVAVKSYKCKGSEQAFREKVEKLSSLNHKNVVKLYHFWIAEYSEFYVYELALRKSMHHCLHELTWAQRYQVAVDIAEGLRYIHDEKDLIHHNIKSSNVLIFEDGTAKLSDLLISKPCSCNGSFPLPLPLPLRGRREPCKHFHPPEFSQDGDTLHGDIYNYGVVLLELLTGKKLEDPTLTSGTNLVSWATPLLTIEEKDDLKSFGGIVLKNAQTETPPPINEEGLKRIVDGGPKEDYSRVKKIAEVVIWCVENQPSARPSMDKVLKYLDTCTDSDSDPEPEHHSETTNKKRKLQHCQIQ